MSEIKRGTGLLIIEVVNSNPNGDPDRESDPRQRHDERGMISPVSFKRKLRDLVEAKDGPVWQKVAKDMGLKDDEFSVLESRDRGFNDIKEAKESWEKAENLTEKEKANKYWDARIFGATFLESDKENKNEKGDKKKYIRSGVVQFGLGVSLSPVTIERSTTTKKASAEKDKDRGMAPLAFRIVQHGVYCMPFFVNPTAAVKSGCTQRDIDLMLALIPYAYPHNPSYIRPQVNVRHAWFVEHKDALGSCNDFEIIDSLTPKKIGEKDEPSTSWEEYYYEEEQKKAREGKFGGKVEKVIDLMAGK